LPKVRECDEHAIVVADGFSCREQVAQLTNRRALHPSQVLKMAIDDRGVERNDKLPERRYMVDPALERRRLMRNGATALGILACFGAVASLLALRSR
jgi:hypothetical protein